MTVRNIAHLVAVSLSAFGLVFTGFATPASATTPEIVATGSNSSTILSAQTLVIEVNTAFTVTNNGSDLLFIKNIDGQVAITAGASCSTFPAGCVLSSASGGSFTLLKAGLIQVGSQTLFVGQQPTPKPTAPGTPGKPAAVAGVASATVTVVAPTTGGAPTSYSVTSAPDGKTCTVTVPATSCEVTGLTNGTSYTFTAVAKNATGSSEPSAASNAVTPNLKPNTPTVAPQFANKKEISRPGVSVLLKNGVVLPSGISATPRVRFIELVQGARPIGDVAPTKLGTYRVTKSGKVIATVLSRQPMTIMLVLSAPATDEYAAYKIKKQWVLK